MRLFVCMLACAAVGCAEPFPPPPPQQPLVLSDSAGAAAWRQVAAGTYGSCGLTADSTAYCWGFRMPMVCVTAGCGVDVVPTKVPTSLRFSTIGVYNARACAVSGASALYCWGETYFGTTLGDGLTATSATPVQIPTVRPVAALAVGYEHACYLDDQGTAYCWGSAYGAIGDGTVGLKKATTPVAVATTIKFSTISAGLNHTCAISLAEDAYCWGHGQGAIGLGAKDTSCTFGPSCYTAIVPEMVVGGIKWKSISAGYGTCGVAVDGKGYCWGGMRSDGDTYGPTGELGSGSLEGSKSPVAVSGGHTFLRMAAGGGRNCGITDAGDALCWGKATSGQLGTGASSITTATPVSVAGALHFETLALGQNATCGVTAGKNAFCWGIAASGNLGNGVGGPGMQTVPTRVSAPAP